MVSKRSAGEHLRTEAALLLLCARTQIEAPVADQIRSLLSRPLDWDYFNQLLLRHRITTLCYRSLRQFAQYGVPAPVLDNLHASVQQLTWYSLGQLGELCRVMALFNTQAIRAIPFKGPLLGIMAYGDPLLHLCADLDILVPEAQFEQAKALLLSHGYTSTSTPVLRNAPESAVHQVYHHGLLNRQQPQVTMELHWKVDECAFISPFDALFAQEVGATLTVGGSTMPVFTPESLLLLLCQPRQQASMVASHVGLRCGGTAPAHGAHGLATPGIAGAPHRQQPGAVARVIPGAYLAGCPGVG